MNLKSSVVSFSTALLLSVHNHNIVFGAAFAFSPTPNNSHTNHSMKAAVYIALTLDGYIAAKDGSIDFLNPYQEGGSTDDEAGDMAFAPFLSRMDLLIMGRNTWDQVISFGEDMWPYGEMPVWIFTRDPDSVTIPECRAGQAKGVSSSPPELMGLAKEKGYKSAYVDGGATVQEFMRHGCVDEFILARIPLLLGSGIPLFSEMETKLDLQHLKTVPLSNGIVQSHYRVKR